MPVLFARIAESEGPARYISMASRYIFRAMYMSPRISVVRNGAREAVEGAEARRSEPAAGFSCALPGNGARETAKQQHAKRIREKEIMVDPPCCHYIPFSPPA